MVLLILRLSLDTCSWWVCTSTAAVEDVIICVQSWDFFTAHLCHTLCCANVSPCPTASHHFNRSSSSFCTGGLQLCCSSLLIRLPQFTTSRVPSLPALHNPPAPPAAVNASVRPHLELHVLLLSLGLVIIFSAAVSLCVWVFVWMSFLFLNVICFFIYQR